MPSRLSYSWRSAIIGSVAAAPYAGTKDAVNDAESNTSEARTNVVRSFGANPNSSAFAKRVVRIAARNPAPVPMPTIPSESRRVTVKNGVECQHIPRRSVRPTGHPDHNPRTCQTLALTVQSIKATWRPSGDGTAKLGSIDSIRFVRIRPSRST
jgi:hypothetical protein